MKYVVDTHTHTISSGHAYNTLLENIKEASQNGIELIATTDHGPDMPGGPHKYYFANIKVLPREINGVTVLRGCEANIIDFQGNLDIPDKIQKNLDIIIASLHDVCIRPGSKEGNTKALIGAMENPYVDIIGHCGNPVFPIDEEKVVRAAKEKNVLIEINNSSLMKGGAREGSIKTCTRVAKLCKEYGVKIVIGSDAHSCFQVGRFDDAHKMLAEVGMPEELIINTQKDRILKYLKKKGKLADLKLD
ncbi:phosphatase [Clostridium sp. SYSU_GA19001]|uniref:phosphatase n=1 Tax=Clostridium caldaquaticum TaxID=2940653 RepID=UPI0020778DC3|nr:phosphatase [Clostridium caldaquaticum]MCM8710160.1 phosphatase [Clostridium caldaquaticum]